MFRGSLVALITPMRPDGDVDEPALRRLVRWHVERGSDALVPLGTTGEASTLDDAERDRVLRIVVEEAGGALPVIAGCGSNDVAVARRRHAHARCRGADAALHAAGYYNRPGQEGLFRHFEAVAAADDLPIVVYNVPARTAVDVAPAECAAMQRACRDGDFVAAAAIQQRLTPLHAALFAEPSPAGVKHACARLGLCDARARLPMVPLGPAAAAAIDAALDGLGLGAAHAT